MATAGLCPIRTTAGERPRGSELAREFHRSRVPQGGRPKVGTTRRGGDGRSDRRLASAMRIELGEGRQRDYARLGPLQESVPVGASLLANSIVRESTKVGDRRSGPPEEVGTGAQIGDWHRLCELNWVKGDSGIMPD